MSDIILELRVPTMCYDMAGKCYTQSTMEEIVDIRSMLRDIAREIENGQ